MGKTPKKQLVNKVYMMQREEERTIVVGDWKDEGMISSDRGESWHQSVERTTKIVFMHTNELVVGIRAVYSDSSNNFI